MPVIIHQRRAKVHLKRDAELQEFINKMSELAKTGTPARTALYREALDQLVFLASCEGFAYRQRPLRIVLRLKRHAPVRVEHRFRRVAQ